MSDVRTRFAPSPTGYLHVGGLRTAVFAWLVARHNQGQFILRLEDTDKKREVEGSAEHVIKSLKALGLDYDEGPDSPGKFGPYRQSERLQIYKVWANKLIESGRAYADPYSLEEVQAYRETAAKAKQPFLYRNHRPDSPGVWDGTSPLRFKSEPKAYEWQDAVMGGLHSVPEVIDDFILIKTDGYPTYNFAHVIDDYLMAITHVIRGQEFISSVPNYLNLYEALNIQRPILATVPHILGADGKKKLSKRDGAKDVLDYLRDGLLPEALINFIATLGWNDGTEQEIFSRQELIDKFSLDRVNRSGAHFDEKRLLWMNGSYIRNYDLDDLLSKVGDYWPEEAKDYSHDYKKQILSLVQERLKYFAELPELTRFFFIDLSVDLDLIIGHKQLKKFEHSELKNMLELSKEKLTNSNFSVSDLTDKLNQLLSEVNQKPAVLFSLIRIATTQAPASPGLAETLHVLGKERSLARIDRQLEEL
jgi:glutamyl-tRNA synthetase